VKPFILDIIGIRWLEECGIRIICVAQNTKPSIYVSATLKGIEDMQHEFNWIGDQK